MLTRWWPLWFCGFLVIGCGRPPETGSVDFGRFEGEVVAVWEGDGRHMTLREDFAYVDAQNRRWVAPAGSTVDGASIPRAFWSIIGGPFEGRYRNASVIHDVGCVEMRDSWEDVHRVFYEACRCGGVDEQQAKIMYYAVYHFGPRWTPVAETHLEWKTNDDGQTVQEPVVVNRMVRVDPPPPTQDEIEQVQEFIVEDNPDATLIEQVNPEVLRRRPRGKRGGPSRTADGSGGPRFQGEDSAEGEPRQRRAESTGRPDWPSPGAGRR